MTPQPGDPIYVPAEERDDALALGAIEIPGDARMFVPRPLPRGRAGADFRAWSGMTARVRWAGEILGDAFGEAAAIPERVGIPHGCAESDVVPLFVPRQESDTARAIPGVRWDRRRRQYVATSKADLGLIFRFLTPAAQAGWMADRALDAAAASMVRAAAVTGTTEDGDQIPEIERLRAGEERGGPGGSA